MDEEKQLEALKAQMGEKQRKEMAELISNEMKRRAAVKARPAGVKSAVNSSRLSTGIGAEHLGEVYTEMGGKVRALRMAKAGAARAHALAATGLGAKRRSFTVPWRALLIAAVVACGILKVVLGNGTVSASERSTTRASLALPPPVEYVGTIERPRADEPPKAPAQEAFPSPADRRFIGWSETEKQLLTELDARRVELEKRRHDLDRREANVKAQSSALEERTAELRSLTTRLAEGRKDTDHRYESRLEQLANVYGSMAPNEAAPLIAKLEDGTAIALLQRMPGKRMGQILSGMDQERAIQLTKILTDKKDGGKE